MVNLGALNWFDSFIKMLKKALDCINHVIYTPDDGFGIIRISFMLTRKVVMYCIVLVMVLLQWTSPNLF